MSSSVLGLREGVVGAHPVTSSSVDEQSTWKPTWTSMDDGGWLVGWECRGFPWDRS